MPNAYKRQLKDKNQDYIYPVLDPADMDKKLDKDNTDVNTLYATGTTAGTQRQVPFSSAANAWNMAFRGDGGTLQVGTPTADAHATTKKYVDGGFKKLDGSNSTFEVKGGGSAQNVAGYRVLCELTPGGWSNYRLVMSVSSRHAGNGIYTITLGNNAESVTTGNEYGKISLTGTHVDGYSNQGSINQGLLSFYRNGTKVYLIVYFSDYDTQHYTILEKFNWPASAMPKGDGTWMTSIDSSVYGTEWRKTEINYANQLTGNGRITSADVTHQYNGGVAHQRLDIATSNMTTSKPSGDGYIQTFTWDNEQIWDSQLYIPLSTGNHPQLRCKGNASWSAWKDIAYVADIPDVSGYLPKSGGQMTGNLTWKDGTALPQFSGTPPYFLGMESFANGATTKWASWDTVKNGILSNGSITTAKLADKAVTPAKIDFTTKPVWSTIVRNSVANGSGTATTLRGTSLGWTADNGGTVFRVTSGAGSINMFRQTITAQFTTTLTNDIGFHNAKAGSHMYCYWTGVSNGNYANKGDFHDTDSNQNYGTCIVTNGNKGNLSINITGTRVDTTANVWSLHAEMQFGGSATSFIANIEITAKDANSLPTLYQRGATPSNTKFVRNVIDVLEE